MAGRIRQTGLGAWIGRRFAGALLAIAACLAAGAATGQEAPPASPAAGAEQAAAVEVRVWPHKGYGRIVFDWPRPPVHTLSRQGDDLTVAFDAPFDAKIDDIAARLGAYVTAARLSGDARAVAVALKPGVRFKSYKTGNSLVVDLLPPAAGKTAGDAGVVPVRIGTHVDFNRLVFDWPVDVDYGLAEKDGRTVVTFRRSGRIDVGALKTRLPPLVRAIDVAGSDSTPTVTLDLVPGAEVRHFRRGMSVVVDVLRPKGNSPAAGAGTVVQAVAPPPAKPRAVTAPPRRAAASEAKPATPAASAAVASLPDATGPVALFDMSGAPVNTLAQRVLAPPAPESAAREAPTPLVGTAAAAKAGDKVPVILTLDKDEARITFHWPEPVGAAVFERAGHLWAVFDRDVRFAFDGWDKAMEKPSPNSRRQHEEVPALAFIAMPQSSKMPGTSVFRMKVPQGVSPRVTRDGAAWSVVLKRDSLSPASGIGVESHSSANSAARLFLAHADAAQAVAVADPEVGDRIWIVPVVQPGRGIGLGRTYAEVELFATGQGIAGRTMNEGIVFRTLPQGIEIAGRDGLTLSGVSSGARALRGPQIGGGSRLPGRSAAGRLFDFDGWRREGGFVANRHTLLRAAAMASPTSRGATRLELAQLFFAYDHYTDALGLLEVIEQDEPALADEPAFRALRGAALYMLGDLERAGRDLTHAGLDTYGDIDLWRAGLFAARKDWAVAGRYFARAETVLPTYPVGLQHHFGLRATEAAMANGDLDLAKFHLSRLDTLQTDRVTRARMGYLRGRLLARMQDPAGAEAALRQAVQGPDRRIHVLSSLALTDLLLEGGGMEKAEAVKALEKLRYAWRGDELEFRVLDRLGRAYLTLGDYKNGLMTLKDVATNFAEAPGVDKVIEVMRAAFIKLYVDGEADRLPPLTALALYDQFRELTPPGPVGDALVSRLAERLVAVDLLDRAATLLRHLVDERVGGTARIDAANRLALVYLLDRKPQEALEVLAGQVPAGLAPKLAEARRQLKARALTEVARYKDALDLLKGDATLDADRLRAEVFWKMRDWPNAAVAYAGIVMSTAPAQQGAKEVQPLGSDVAQDVLSLAIAYTLSRNQGALQDLRARFLDRMGTSAFKDAFDVITAPSGIVPDDFRAITSRVAEADRFQAFMRNYRDKLLGRDRAPAPSAAPPGAPAAAPPPPPQAQGPAPSAASG